ncbi:MAG: hypothetical protein AB7S86_02360 [Hydrogenophaga sp.]|uniref:hypothetical protein n=1 Tax=Hydrogenophaga sp. TaxID=1904254 RepID=UPI003D12E24B
MRLETTDVLQAVNRPSPLASARGSHVLLAGATGALGEAMVTRLASSSAVRLLSVVVREPMVMSLRRVKDLHVLGDDPARWPVKPAEEGWILMDPPRLFHGREKAMLAVQPEGLRPLAAWMRRCGVSRLVVVLPHQQGRLPEAIKRGLATLDEQAVVAMGFGTVLLLRSAQPGPRVAAAGSFLNRLAAGLLGALHYLVPSNQKPVRAEGVARVATIALKLAPPGIHVAAPELVWAAASAPDPEPLLSQWLHRLGTTGDNRQS